MKNEAIYAVLLAFFLNIVISPFAIPLLKRLKFGQNVRNDGPGTHLKKMGTPTMGGIIILLSMVTATIFFLKENEAVQTILFVTVGFGVIGFIDDYIKVVKKRSLGLTPMQKIIGQLIITCVFAYLLTTYVGIDTSIIIPFTGRITWDLGIFYWPFLIFTVLAVVNAVNLTDGIDGLAASVTVLVATFFAAIALMLRSESVPVAAATVGSLLGFLLFNSYPAKVFMGDTGSMALGGAVVAFATLTNSPLLIIIVGFVYLAEALSVMLQVSYFKLTHGKRIFKMAPLHHHFEQCGWPETRVVFVFWIVTVVLCWIGVLAVF